MGSSKAAQGVLVLLLFLASWTSALRCPGPDWYYRRATDKCYYIQQHRSLFADQTTVVGIEAGRMQWRDAVNECALRGGKIATFSDYEEMEWVKAKLEKGIWYWVGLTYENLRWEWYDGVTFTQYVTMDMVDDPPTPEGSTSEKRNQRAALYFVESTKRFEWDLETVAVHNQNGFICKGDWSGKPWCKVEAGWSFHNGHCYQHNPTPMYYHSAEQRCLAGGGTLWIPSSQEEDVRVTKWLRQTLRIDKAWLGIAIQPKRANTTIDSVTWADGSPFRSPPLDNWMHEDMDTYIRNLTNDRDYCGEITSTSKVDESFWTSAAPAVHDWDLTDSCGRAVRRPFLCEAPLNRCPYGWSELDDECYQFNLGSANLKNWTDARSHCEAQNSALVMIKTKRQQDFVADINEIHWSNVNRNQYWIGLENKRTNYVWMDGSALDYNNWSFSADEASSGECVYIEGDHVSSNTAKWRTAVCHARFNYICQAHYTADIQPEDIIHPPLECVAPYEKYHDGCYLVVKEQKNQGEAQKYCQNNGGAVLGLVRTFGENNWLSERVTADAWIGLSITGTRVLPITGGTKRVYVYEYSDGTEMIEGNWRYFDELLDAATMSQITDRFCVAMAGVNSQFNLIDGGKPRRGFWYHASCTETREFVCYHEGTPKQIDLGHDDNYDPACGAGWFRHGDSCYRPHTNYAPWGLAKQICQNTDPTADLLWITTKAEEDFITDFLEYNKTEEDFGGGRDGDDHWIDIYSDNGTGNWYWPYRNETDVWFMPMAVTNWGMEEPKIIPASVGGERPRCGLIDLDYVARWSTAPCDHEKAFICKKHVDDEFLSVPPTAAPTVPPVGICLPEWTGLHGRCVRPNMELLNWTDARAACQTLGGELSSVHDWPDLNAIQSLARNAWIGLNTLENPSYRPRLYTWSDGLPMTYLPWHTQSHNKTRNCGVVLDSKGFGMFPCDELRPSVCAKIISPATTVLTPGLSSSPPTTADLPSYTTSVIGSEMPSTKKASSSYTTSVFSSGTEIPTTKRVVSSVTTSVFSSAAPTIVVISPFTTSATGSQEPHTESTLHIADLKPTLVTKFDTGLSGSEIAGIVVGVLIVAAIVGAVGVIAGTGRTRGVLLSVRTVTSKVKKSAANRLNPGGQFPGFSGTRYNKANDQVLVSDEFDYRGQPDSYS
ncbi:putative Secretory phospholipase A2 receptor [Hypsibius exemplaris]|uniref:Secretory phospholipase A2 receptor n=1 Tax=Hypsibius exemplaris TaxID=2072580 RepID=A0A9X6RNR6_HYPEX|nr:putative Secretory phospholipase A2 receptor [Hypsibius exemplaris]